MKPVDKVVEVRKLLEDPLGEFTNLSIKDKLVGKLAIIEGMTSNEIAEEIGVSYWSVLQYVRNVCLVMDCKKHQLSSKLLKQIKAILDESSE